MLNFKPEAVGTATQEGPPGCAAAAYTMEGYVLIVGAQHGHGKLLTYASLAKRWELLLDHDFASLLFYANTATNIVVYIVLGPVVLLVNAEDRAGSL